MQVSLQVAGFCRFLQVSCKFLEFKKINLQKTLHGDNLHFDITKQDNYLHIVLAHTVELGKPFL